MRVTAYSITNKGGRELNEDSIRCQSRAGRSVFVLCDGLGGHDCGEVASAIAADTLLEGCLSAEALTAEAMNGVLLAANDAVLAAQQTPERRDMRTTAVALALSGDRAVWGHVGDSRLYRYTGGELAQVTRDHSVTYMKFLGGEIGAMDVYHDEDRSSLLRVLGKEPCRPETGEGALAPGDAFLLCSDGFWEYVYTEELLLDLLKADSPESWARAALLRHIRRVPKGNDNFSVITVFVEDGE